MVKIACFLRFPTPLCLLRRLPYRCHLPPPSRPPQMEPHVACFYLLAGLNIAYLDVVCNIATPPALLTMSRFFSKHKEMHRHARAKGKDVKTREAMFKVPSYIHFHPSSWTPAEPSGMNNNPDDCPATDSKVNLHLVYSLPAKTDALLDPSRVWKGTLNSKLGSRVSDGGIHA